MIELPELARAAIEILAANPAQRDVEIDTAAFTRAQVSELIDTVFEEGAAAGIAIKGVVVDPMQVPLPGDAEFINAFRRDGRLVFLDINVDDKVIVKRAKP
ncbi:hypothetical protein [Allosphingosinicella deserti]|uniref:Uncharacterized protein n=1 Tax=Allosphingosinicella deserti TaxID=2116704 RepID=A0A2P7QE81_9SPHN|nr:hypothetical protein [Sphingomonas deserti]PSJ36282.1 hypothetical protein C7I55_26675 [Sphingomonas deserti]